MLQERKNLAIFLTLLWVLHFIFVWFLKGGEKKSTETFCKFFLCAARFFVFVFCFFPEERNGTYVVRSQTGPFLLLNLPLICSQFWNQSMKICTNAIVYKNCWLILGGICYSLFLYGYVYALLYKNN